MRRNALIGLVTIAGITLSAMFFSFYRSWEDSYVRTEFNIIAERNYSAVDEALYKHFLIARSIKAFFESSTHVDRDEFRTFTGAFLEDNLTIQALEWIPRVTHEQRAGFEAEHAAQLPGFRIMERSPEGKMVVRTPAQEYYPVTLLEPLEGNRKAVGFDLASNETRLKALVASRTGDRAVATARIKLVQEKGEMFGFLLFMPVYRNPEKENEFKGFVLGVFRIGDIIKESMEHLDVKSKMTEIRLLDVTTPDKSELLYESGNFTRDSGLALEKTFDVAGREWKLTIVPTPEFLKGYHSIIDFAGLGVGLLFTLLVSAYLANMANQSEMIRRQVLERTEELNKTKEGLEKLIHTIEEGIILIDAQRNIQMFNPAAERIFQYMEDEVVGKNVKLLMPEPYHSRHDEYVMNFVNSGGAKIIGIGREVRGRRKDGNVFPLHLAISEMEMDNTRYFVGAIKDITQQKDVEKKLTLAKEAAEEAYRIKSEFMNTMSHELRTPLTIILGNIEEITDEEDMPDMEDIAEIARDCSKAGEMLMRLVNDILDLSKIEAGKMTLEKERMSSTELISDVVTTTRVLAENKGLELNVQGDETDIYIDPVRIKQVLFNLLSNAVKFTEQGSVSVITRIQNDLLVMTVADTGQGMNAESLTYIFEPFRQVDGSSTRKVGGTGLGLAITKKLVELHGGTIRVESEVDKGSSFIIELPIDAGDDEDAVV
ncbi:MAG: CHASE domain-containing protein [Desulfobacter sp.]